MEVEYRSGAMATARTSCKRGIPTDRLLALAGISSTQLHYWVDKGLVPSYQRRKAYGGNGFRFWYPPETLEIARKVKSWREQGKPYSLIRMLIKAKELAERDP